TTLATTVPPVKKMWSHGCSSSAVVSGLAPRTTEKAPWFRYSGRSRAITSAVAGATSEGLTTAAIPPLIAARSGPGEHQRVVPRPDDEAPSERVELHLDMGGPQHDRRADRERLHPLPQV